MSLTPFYSIYMVCIIVYICIIHNGECYKK